MIKQLIRVLYTDVQYEREFEMEKEKIIEKLNDVRHDLMKIENELFEIYGVEPKSPGAILSDVSYIVASLTEDIKNNY
ncbi:hypothetical protein CSE16_11765 [Solibacillus sp. R5-41]|uniref:hypothetical protein n=1 Tax=Solibacillus sp. R5-41 TaxID=2048654 RepID=UPI000C125ABE|nr:hypothetical protein [Solibacillus sp. R5-41]ATP40669.1 hypothetical protein CSE16_11765 [Solibacillus sp. R5-41]